MTQFIDFQDTLLRVSATPEQVASFVSTNIQGSPASINLTAEALGVFMGTILTDDIASADEIYYDNKPADTRQWLAPDGISVIYRRPVDSNLEFINTSDYETGIKRSVQRLKISWGHLTILGGDVILPNNAELAVQIGRARGFRVMSKLVLEQERLARQKKGGNFIGLVTLERRESSRTEDDWPKLT